ncbi:PREDICTED: F-box/kelch-repeat protein At3g23880-like [Ipomoea nil]|uniref:F-box/kelch-repeat protein At3g23880-like n=1 Tax=Ipomoea nil TaxID=35883 RepID=UPI000901BB7D|nr:PREDICTED: F-box/kelch-repeat protein At3g23880-like [Ipomoea nil]
MSFPTPKRHMPQPNLNQDIITKILKRLAVKSLLQFRKQAIITSQVYYIDRSVLIPKGGFEFLGSCNGLFCFRAKPYQIMIWNPSLNGNIKTIPDVWRSGNIISIFGFGCDMHNQDYKVVYAYYAENNGDENVILVYKFKRGSWKRSDRGFSSGFVYPRIAGFVSCSLNWCNNNLDDSEWNWNIISFNLTTETAKGIALPSHEHGAAICIGESRGLLFAGFHHKHQMEVWVMNEFGVEAIALPLHHPLLRGSENTAYRAP